MIGISKIMEIMFPRRGHDFYDPTRRHPKRDAGHPPGVLPFRVYAALALNSTQLPSSLRFVVEEHKKLQNI